MRTQEVYMRMTQYACATDPDSLHRCASRLRLQVGTTSRVNVHAILESLRRQGGTLVTIGKEVAVLESKHKRCASRAICCVLVLKTVPCNQVLGWQAACLAIF